jgi:hypothetical protein
MLFFMSVYYSKLIGIIYKYVLCMEYFWYGCMFHMYFLFHILHASCQSKFCKTHHDYRCES